MRPGRSPRSHRSISTTALLAGPRMWQISGSRVIRQMTRSGLPGSNLPEGRLEPVYESATIGPNDLRYGNAPFGPTASERPTSSAQP